MAGKRKLRKRTHLDAPGYPSFFEHRADRRQFRSAPGISPICTRVPSVPPIIRVFALSFFSSSAACSAARRASSGFILKQAPGKSQGNTT